MVSVTQRIVQYNREVGQPRGGLVNPKLLETTQLSDEHGLLDIKLENIHPSAVGLTVEYLTRLARIRALDATDARRQAADVFRAALTGAGNISDFNGNDTARAQVVALAGGLELAIEGDEVRYVIDDEAIRTAYRLSTFDVAAVAGPTFYKSEATKLSPNGDTTSHIAAMVNRTANFFETHGPVTRDGFSFVSAEDYAAGGRGAYTDLIGGGIGDFLTADTVWEMKVSVSKPTKDHALQLLIYFLMGKQSGLPQFNSSTHLGIFNPRLNAVYRLAVADLPSEVIETVRRDVIGYTD